MKNKVTAEQIIKEHQSTLKKIEEYNIKLTREIITPLFQQFEKENSPIEPGKVYEVKPIHGNKAPRGFKRFLPVATECHIIFRDTVTIEVGGWWLSETNNIGQKWASITVFGIGNPYVFELSENQNAILPLENKREFERHGKVFKKLSESFPKQLVEMLY